MLHTSSDSTAAAQEHPDEATRTEVSPPQAPPTGPDISADSHARSLESVKDTSASSSFGQASFVKEVNEAVPAQAEQHGIPNVPKTTEHHHTPCSPQGSRQGSPCVQNDPAQLPRRGSQPELCKEKNRPAGRSNWQAPFVEDADKAKDKSTEEDRVSHPPTSHPTGRDVEPVVEPVVSSMPSPIEKLPTQGPPRNSGSTHADQETCSNKDSTAAERSSPRTTPADKPHADRAGIPEETCRKWSKRKRPVADKDTVIAKRKCLEYPVIDNPLNRPWSPAFDEGISNYLQGFVAPVSEDVVSEPAPQECGGHPETCAPASSQGPMFATPTPLQADGSCHSASVGQTSCCQTSYEGRQSEQATGILPDCGPYHVPNEVPGAQGMFDSATMSYDKGPNPGRPDSCGEPGATAAPTEAAYSEPAEQFTGEAITAAASPQRERGAGDLPTEPLGDNSADGPTAPPSKNVGETAHYSRDPPLCDPFQKNANSTNAEHTTAQDPFLHDQFGHSVQESSPAQSIQVNDVPGNESFQTNVPRSESVGPKTRCPTAAASIPPAASPLASIHPDPIEEVITQASVTEPTAVSSESIQMENSEGVTQGLTPGQPQRTDHQPIESVGKPRKRRRTSPCVPLETADDNKSHQDAPAPAVDISRGPERMCHQSGDPNTDSDSVSDTNTHMDDDVHMDDDARMESSGRMDDDAHMEGSSRIEDNAPMEDNGHTEENRTASALEDKPNKRFCSGLDSPNGLLFASEHNANDTQVGSICDDMTGVSPAGALDGTDISAPQSASGFIFIVELDGEEVTFVHRRARGTIRPWHERHLRLRSKSGNFFNGLLQIVEIDPDKSGAISIDRYFQTEEVLVFQHSNHDEAKIKRLVKKINRAVSSSKKAALHKSVKKRYYLRARKRRKT